MFLCFYKYGSVFSAVCDFVFVCHSNISGTAERICTKIAVKTCLVPGLDEFECQGQRSWWPETKNEKLMSHPLTMHCKACAVRCKWRHAAAADDTIPSPPGVTGWRQCTLTEACVRFMFGKASLALVMAALWYRAGHYIFALWFLSSIFFFSSPNLSGRRLDVYHTSTHGVAQVRI